MRRAAALAAALLALLVVAAWPERAAAAPPEVVVRFSHVVAPGTPKGQAAQLFARRAAELTGGRIRVDVFANGTLYQDHEEIEALQLGAVDLLAPSLSKFGPLGVTEFEAFDLPFLFDGEAAVHRVTQGPVGRALLDRLEDRGIAGLTFWDNGFKCFSANRPLRAPEDFKGLRFRIQASGVLDAQMRALGARPMVLPFPDVYRALEAGVVDGAENPISNFHAHKMAKVQRHLTVTRHGYLGYAVIANRRFWRGLPGDLRQALEQALAEATEYQNRLARETDEADLAAERAAGLTAVVVPTPAERARLAEALRPLQRAMAERVGREFLMAIRKATGQPAELP